MQEGRVFEVTFQPHALGIDLGQDPTTDEVRRLLHTQDIGLSGPWSLSPDLLLAVHVGDGVGMCVVWIRWWCGP